MTASKRFLDNALRVEAERRAERLAAEVSHLRSVRTNSRQGISDPQILAWIDEGFVDAVASANERFAAPVTEVDRS